MIIYVNGSLHRRAAGVEGKLYQLRESSSLQVVEALRGRAKFLYTLQRSRRRRNFFPSTIYTDYDEGKKEEEKARGESGAIYNALSLSLTPGIIPLTFGCCGGGGGGNGDAQPVSLFPNTQASEAQTRAAVEEHSPA